jgi:hypothetical protein
MRWASGVLVSGSEARAEARRDLQGVQGGTLPQLVADGEEA